MKQTAKITVSEIICKTLEMLGIEVSFGLPGTNDAQLYHSLHSSSIRHITPTSELAASFMANGYYRSSGKIAVVTTILGPGFTYALSGVAEAFLDSVPMLFIVGAPYEETEKLFHHQSIDQKSMIKPIVKGTYQIKDITNAQEIINEAFLTAKNEEPGPVYIEIDRSVYSQTHYFEKDAIKHYSPPKSDSAAKLINEAIGDIFNNPRILFYLGQGASNVSDEIQEIAEYFNSPVVTTSSGRGILPEGHPLLFPYNNVIRGGGKTIKDMIRASDLIIALGCKFSFNGSGGFDIDIPKNKLIHVDAASAVLNTNYPAKIAIHTEVKNFIKKLLRRCKNTEKEIKGWSNAELSQWRKKAIEEIEHSTGVESYFKDISANKPEAFFEILQKSLPDNPIVISDSGQHQMLLRKYYRVPNVRGFIIPSNFQSMGFAVPAAIGAKVANPNATVVVIIGDGGFNISATELLTAIKEQLPLKVIIFNDNSLGLIKINQIAKSGISHSTDVLNPDYNKLAESFKINFIKISDKNEKEFSANLQSADTALFEINLYHKIKGDVGY